MLTGLALPTLFLMLAAVLVTRGIERKMPETPAGLAAIAMLSSLALWLIASALFAGLYASQDSRILSLFATDSGLAHMLGLGAKAAMIWAPLVLLVTITAPQRWKTNRW